MWQRHVWFISRWTSCSVQKKRLENKKVVLRWGFHIGNRFCRTKNNSVRSSGWCHGSGHTHTGKRNTHTPRKAHQGKRHRDVGSTIIDWTARTREKQMGNWLVSEGFDGDSSWSKIAFRHTPSKVNWRTSRCFETAAASRKKRSPRILLGTSLWASEDGSKLWQQEVVQEKNHSIEVLSRGVNDLRGLVIWTTQPAPPRWWRGGEGDNERRRYPASKNTWNKKD